MRAYFVGGFQLRNLLTNAILVVSGVVNTLSRLNDSTPAGPASGFSIVIAAGTSLFSNTILVGTGFSGNPVSMVPFRPNTSVQPWEYVADSAPQGDVTLITKSLFSGAPVDFVTNGLVKVRSDGLAYKTGVKEPQLAPEVSTVDGNGEVKGNLLATAIPWTNYAGANPDFNYGETEGFPNVIPPIDGTAPFIINVQNATTLTFNSITGTATINGGSKTPTSLGPATNVNTNPGHYIQIAGTGGTPATATVVVGAFINASGDVMPIGVAPLFIPSVVDVGASIGSPIQIPFGAVSFQVGINSTGNTFSANAGLFVLDATVTTASLPTVLSVVAPLTLNFWQDSPTSGPVAAYIWKNPGDPGGGTSRTISNAIGTVSGNSFLFDTTFTDGIPGLPGIGNSGTPMQWFQLNPDESVSGSIPISPTQNANFNFCLYGKIYVPAAGEYSFILTAKDAMMWGIQGATYISQTPLAGVDVALSQFGQTMTVVNGYPLLPTIREDSGEDGFVASIEVVVSFAAAGIYGIEIDYDYWYHSGRTLFLLGSPKPDEDPATIPPLSGGSRGVREQVQYRYVYRSSATGAQSNPSPESAVISLPVASNTVTSFWSDDPQIDLVDYYRIDSATSSFTYVATGPNDDLGGGGTNTPIVDSLSDTQLGDQLLSFDNYEPFPSIDLPQKGTVTVSGGVITWVSGGSIGGTQTGFNLRWLGGTNIVIGSPTGLAYTLIARPTSTTTMTIPGVPDEGEPVQYTIPEPILANQPLPYQFGPTDNINYAYAVGDPLRPGTLYWCAGSNLDAAPDTNQLDVTDPSEALVNGAMSGGRGVLFSIKRAWLIVPNFYNAEATATGTTGATWSLEETAITRGLFIPRCVAVSGGGNIGFRVNDGWHISAGGSASKSITDDTLYPLFPHENSTPQPVVRNGITIYPPDDSQPNKQKAYFIGAYMYWDYFGTDGNYHTLVFDEAAKGWIYDLYQVPVTARASNDDIATQGVLCGCVDGTVRNLSSTEAATESATGTVLSGAMGSKGYQHCGALVLEYSSLLPIALTSVAADEGNGSYGFAPISLPATDGIITKYFVRPSPNKTKLMQVQFASDDPAMQIYMDGCVAYIKPWGTQSAYSPVQIFGDQGGEG